MEIQNSNSSIPCLFTSCLALECLIGPMLFVCMPKDLFESHKLFICKTYLNMSE